jgi:hypothetical protein
VSDGMARAVDGSVQLARWWVQAWSDHAAAVAGRMNAKTYTYDQMVDDACDAANLAAESMVLFVSEAYDACAVMKAPGTRAPLESDLFRTSDPLPPNGSERVLRLGGALRALLGQHVLSPSTVTVRPPTLSGMKTEFRLEVDPTGKAGLAYTGSVEVVDAVTGAHLESVTVWIIVP